MALDKQRILSELGSVVNQLQSAECGCMGKLFSNSGQPTDKSMNSSLPTCGGFRRGCCHGHGYNCNCNNTPCSTGSAGESNLPMSPHIHRPCVTNCNPPKLYADTYGYLNQNLMQPVVKEVYDDLKSISPTNTIMNNPMANLVGMSHQGSNIGQNMGNPMQHNPNTPPRGNIPNMMQPQIHGGMALQNMSGSYPNQQGSGHMGGMGPDIVNMIMGSSSHKSNLAGTPQGQGESMTNSMPVYGNSNENAIPGSNGFSMQNSPKPSCVQNSNFLTCGDAHITHSQPPNIMNSTHPIPNANPNQQSAQMNPRQHMYPAKQQTPYGMHSQGISKFNEMFPGVMQGPGGDLGFDPMAIAIQMNPANQQKAAIDTMQKLMGGMGNNKTLNSPLSAPVLAGGGHPQNISPKNNQIQEQMTTQHQIQPYQQQPVSNNGLAPTQQLTGVVPPQQQQIYATTTSTVNHPQTQDQQLQRYDQNMDSTTLQQHNNAQLSDQTISQQELIKEPIFPANISRNQFPLYTTQRPYEYNTLGQPVEMLPAKMFRSPVSNLPQTLSPQDTPSMNGQVTYSNVKSTVSKTPLVGSKPLGKTPSRSQLQHIYNQYKGSHSYTQQNVNQPAKGASHSDGKLNITQKNYSQIAPMERIGDSASNKMTNDPTLNKMEHVMGHIGDTHTAKPGGDGGTPDSMPVANNSKCRNGLQDMVYTSYPTTTAWSFHGDRMPYSGGRLRRRA